jgi:hypothetical protein
MSNGKKTIFVLFILNLLTIQIYAQQYPSGSNVGVRRDKIIISVTTPAGWICDYDFAHYIKMPCAFVKENAYADGRVDVTHQMTIYLEEEILEETDPYTYGENKAREQYLKNGPFKEIDYNLNNTTNINDYALYEFIGPPPFYKELHFRIKTDVSTIIINYLYVVGEKVSDSEKAEEIYQENILAFYELLKTVKITNPKN